jgi:hypothetical protein
MIWLCFQPACNAFHFIHAHTHISQAAQQGMLRCLSAPTTFLTSTTFTTAAYTVTTD